MDVKTLFLAELLNCGTADLCIIEDCEYDISDIIDMCYGFTERIDLGAIAYAITELAKRELSSLIEEKIRECEHGIEELKAEGDYDDIVEHQQIVIGELQMLDPHEDLELYFNYLDTNIPIVKNVEIYETHLSHEIEKVSNNCGIAIY